MIAFETSVNGTLYCEDDEISAVTLFAREPAQLGSRDADALKSGSRLPLGSSIRDEGQACGFCRRKTSDISGPVVRNGAAICAECIHACEALVQDK